MSFAPHAAVAPHRLLGLALVGAMSCEENPFLDPYCASPGRYPAETGLYTTSTIGLFTEDGRPIEIPGARVTCGQGSGATNPARWMGDFFHQGATLGPGGAITGASSGLGAVFNAYECQDAPALRRCSLPLHVRVEAPGCETWERDWTWDDNYRLNGAADFLVPVRLRCAGDAGVDPRLHDLPKLLPDRWEERLDVTPSPADVAHDLDAAAE